jgi:hypothetical protein
MASWSFAAPSASCDFIAQCVEAKTPGVTGVSLPRRASKAELATRRSLLAGNKTLISFVFYARLEDFSSPLCGSQMKKRSENSYA